MLLCWIHWMSEDVFTWKSFVPLVYLNCFVLSSTCFFCSQPNLSPFNLSHHWKTYYVLVRWYPILRQQWYFVYWSGCLMCCSLLCWSAVVPVALMMDRLSQTHCMVSVLMLVSHKFCAATCIFFCQIICWAAQFWLFEGHRGLGIEVWLISMLPGQHLCRELAVGCHCLCKKLHEVIVD